MRRNGDGSRVGPRLSPDGIVTAAAVYAVVAGTLTLVGWVANVPRLTDWKGDGISMFPNTAACAVMSGLALLAVGAARGSARSVVRALATLVAAIGGATLFEHATGIDLGIDAVLVARPWGQAAAAAPMRMGPPGCTSFLMTGLALLLATFGTQARRASIALAVAVVAIATLSLTGHLYGAQQMFTIPRLTGIAMQTSSVLLALGLGIVARLPDREPMRTLLEPSAAGMLARQAWPILVVLAVALGRGRVALQDHGLVDTAFGTALRTLVEIVVVTGLLWWAVGMVRAHERALRASEREVRRQASQLAAFLETAAICLHRAGPDGTILWANDAELATFGYAREEYVGHHIAEFHVDRATIADLLARLHSGQKVFEYAAEMRCKDGTIKSVLIDASVLWDEGRFVHTQCFTRDVTERKRAEAERDEAARRKDEFLAILAHELRNPLGPIRNAAHYLKLTGPADPAFGRPVDMIERQVAQMARLIDDLLDVSRISRRPRRVHQ